MISHFVFYYKNSLFHDSSGRKRRRRKVLKRFIVFRLNISGDKSEIRQNFIFTLYKHMLGNVKEEKLRKQLNI